MALTSFRPNAITGSMQQGQAKDWTRYFTPQGANDRELARQADVNSQAVGGQTFMGGSRTASGELVPGRIGAYGGFGYGGGGSYGSSMGNYGVPTGYLASGGDVKRTSGIINQIAMSKTKHLATGGEAQQSRFVMTNPHDYRRNIRIGSRGPAPLAPAGRTGGLDGWKQMQTRKILEEGMRTSIDPTTGLPYAPKSSQMLQQVAMLSKMGSRGGFSGMDQATALQDYYNAMQSNNPEAVKEARARMDVIRGAIAKEAREKGFEKTPAWQNLEGLPNKAPVPATTQTQPSSPVTSATPQAATTSNPAAQQNATPGSPTADTESELAEYGSNPSLPEDTEQELEEYTPGKQKGGKTSTIHPYIVNEEGEEAWQPKGGKPQLMEGPEQMVVFPKDGKVIPHKRTMQLVKEGKIAVPEHRQEGGESKASRDVEWTKHKQNVHDLLRKNYTPERIREIAKKISSGEYSVQSLRKSLGIETEKRGPGYYGYKDPQLVGGTSEETQTNKKAWETLLKAWADDVSKAGSKEPYWMKTEEPSKVAPKVSTPTVSPEPLTPTPAAPVAPVAPTAVTPVVPVAPTVPTATVASTPNKPVGMMPLPPEFRRDVNLPPTKMADFDDETRGAIVGEIRSPKDQAYRPYFAAGILGRTADENLELLKQWAKNKPNFPSAGGGWEGAYGSFKDVEEANRQQEEMMQAVRAAAGRRGAGPAIPATLQDTRSSLYDALRDQLAMGTEMVAKKEAADIAAAKLARERMMGNRGVDVIGNLQGTPAVGKTSTFTTPYGIASATYGGVPGTGTTVDEATGERIPISQAIKGMQARQTRELAAQRQTQAEVAATKSEYPWMTDAQAQAHNEDMKRRLGKMEPATGENMSLFEKRMQGIAPAVPVPAEQPVVGLGTGSQKPAEQPKVAKVEKSSEEEETPKRMNGGYVQGTGRTRSLMRA